MIKLGMLGTLSLSDADGREVRSVLRQPRRLALLAYLAAATAALTSFPFPYRRPSGVSRPEQSLPCSAPGGACAWSRTGRCHRNRLVGSSRSRAPSRRTDRKSVV